MNTIFEHECLGLDGGNPLLFLSSLGVFRLLCLHDPEACIRWLPGETHHPVYRTNMERDALCDVLARDFGWEPSESVAPEIGTNSKKRKTAKSAGKKEEETRAARLKALFPVVFTGDVIKRPVADFRELAERSVKAPSEWPDALPIQDELVSAFACDGVIEKKSKNGEIPGVAPSLFSFSNGGSGKCLLKDFRTCAMRVKSGAIRNVLWNEEKNEDYVTSLNWDPASQRSYAFQYGDPGDQKNSASCDATANALAFVGLTVFPSVPGRNGISTVGLSSRGEAWTWPLWRPFLQLCVLRSVLNTRPEAEKSSFLPEKDVLVWQSAQRFSLNKRCFFTPSIPVMNSKGG
jgi:hypothetical protein